jgi:hypothetical protein
MTFNKWLDTFVAEKGIDLEATFQFDNDNGFNIMPYGVVVEAIKTTTGIERAAIKTMIVKIDFANGDVLDFFRHLGRGLG